MEEGTLVKCVHCTHLREWREAIDHSCVQVTKICFFLIMQSFLFLLYMTFEAYCNQQEVEVFCLEDDNCMIVLLLWTLVSNPSFCVSFALMRAFLAFLCGLYQAGGNMEGLENMYEKVASTLEKLKKQVQADRQVHVKVGLHVSAFLLLLLQFFNWKVIWGVRES